MPDSVDDSTQDLSRLEAELGTDFTAWKAHMSSLIEANEKYKQENYSLHCKLEVSTTMEQEMREVQEVLEKTVSEVHKMTDKKIRELEDNHLAEKQDLLARLSEIEADDLQKTADIEKLQIQILELNKKLRESSKDMPLIIEEDSGMQEEMTELMAQLLERDHTIQELQESLQGSNNDNAELKEILGDTKQQLSEKNEQLENIRDELMGLKIELAEVKEKPASESCKGNSLFAEVEDRRKKMQEQMSALRKGYHDAKRVVSIKDAQIRSLKADKAALIRKWGDDKVDTQYRDTKLMEKYKERISELEFKLQAQREKYDREFQMRPAESTFSFFQSMLDSKHKEIVELESKLENVSIHAVLDEEMKCKLSRQLRYWRCKAMSNDAQLIAAKTHLKTNSLSSDSDPLHSSHKMTEQSNLEETIVSYPPPPTVVEDSMSVNEILKMSKYSSKRDKSSYDNSMFSSSNENLECSVGPSDESGMQGESEKFDGEAKRMILGEVTNIPAICIVDAEERLGRKIKKEREELSGNEARVDPATTNHVPTLKTMTESNNENTGGVQDCVTLKLKSALVQDSSAFAASDKGTKAKKILKFTNDTIDPPSRTLKRQVTAKYPIIFASNKPTKPVNELP